jgi:hypothetical protein
MFLATLTWPEALVWSVAIVTVGAVVSVAIWQVFRTGQTAIRKDGSRERETVDTLRREVDELRADLHQPA